MTDKKTMRPVRTGSLPDLLHMLVLVFLFLSVAQAARAETVLKPIGGSGGGPFIVYCPGGQNLTGFELRAADDVDAIRPICAVSYGPNEIGVPAAVGGWFGGPGGRGVSLLCPSSAPIVTGMDVAAEGVDHIIVNNIHLYCGEASAVQRQQSSPSAAFDAPNYSSSSGSFKGFVQEHQLCPSGEVAIGLNGRSGTWVDAIGLVCGAPRLPPTVKSLGREVRNSTPGSATSVCAEARAARARNSPAAPNLEAQCRALPPVVHSIGRNISSQASEPPIPVCDAARAARARNSPAAPNLEAQCRARGGDPSGEVAGTPSVSTDDLAARGAIVASRDALATELRSRTPVGPYRRGFDIGMAAAEGQTEWGSGKQRILDSLNSAEQEGFEVAVSYSLDRNRNAALATVGADIAKADRAVAQARASGSDVRYWLGFDIATGIFGARARGAQGNTSTGPGSLRIRDALSAPAQRGFDDAVAFHLHRRH
jgi:hypothetical protein